MDLEFGIPSQELFGTMVSYWIAPNRDNRENRGINKLINNVRQILDFLIYGRCGPLDRLKRLPQGVGTISTPGQPNSENFFFRAFLELPKRHFSTGAIYYDTYLL